MKRRRRRILVGPRDLGDVLQEHLRLAADAFDEQVADRLDGVDALLGQDRDVLAADARVAGRRHEVLALELAVDLILGDAKLRELLTADLDVDRLGLHAEERDLADVRHQ